MGCFLTGYEPGASETSETEGPQLNSCPNSHSTFEPDSTAVGDRSPSVVGLFVNGVTLPITG